MVLFDFEIKNINDGSTFVLYVNEEQAVWHCSIEEIYDEIDSIIENADLDYGDYCITEN